MSTHVYHEIYLHINWHTKGDVPLLKGQVERDTHKFLTERCRNTKGVYLHGIGGTDDHVHPAVSIEPAVTISKLIGELKGGSAHDVNESSKSMLLEWQRGYGVFSFGKGNLDWVLEYIANQRKHHARGTTEDRLEATGDQEDA